MHRTTTQWMVSRCPSPYRFAFTIVHDADSAYSVRLAPLLEAFEDLGLRITVSAFAFWADWARQGSIWSEWRASSAFTAPIAVPVCDPDERRFYERVAARGHEVALHTPSDTSNTRDEVVAAFEFFKTVFGEYPAVYTEHASSSNKDALSNEGADPDSPYYCRDLLQQYDPWVWVDGAGALRNEPDGKFFEIPPAGSWTNRHAVERYGVTKAFVRTGRWSMGDGDGFLACYTEDNIDRLSEDGGIALVYTHLNAGWVDPQTRRLRADIQRRLQYVAAKGGWFVPAGTILERARQADAIGVASDGDHLVLTNSGTMALSDVSVQPLGDGKAIRAEAVQPGTHRLLRETA